MTFPVIQCGFIIIMALYLHEMIHRWQCFLLNKTYSLNLSSTYIISEFTSISE